MWDKIQYAFLYSWVKVHALLPMRALYVLSDILYVLIYKIAGYRVKVVRRNITASFPDKSKAELRQLERRFYHHFADYIVETIKLAHISLDEIQQRAYLKNPELVDQLMKKGHTCFILTMGHYGNWEWFSGSTTRFEDSRIYQIYRPLNNKAFDKLFADLRTQFGSFGIKKNDTGYHQVKTRQNQISRHLLGGPDTQQGQPALLDRVPSSRYSHINRSGAYRTETEPACDLPRYQKGKKRILHRRHEADYGESKRDSGELHHRAIRTTFRENDLA